MRSETHKGNGFTTHLWSFDISFVCCCCCRCRCGLFDIFALKYGRYGGGRRERERLNILVCLSYFFNGRTLFATNHSEWFDQNCTLLIRFIYLAIFQTPNETESMEFRILCDGSLQFSRTPKQCCCCAANCARRNLSPMTMLPIFIIIITSFNIMMIMTRRNGANIYIAVMTATAQVKVNPKWYVAWSLVPFEFLFFSFDSN